MVTLLYSRNWHNTVNQLYLYERKKEGKKERKRKKERKKRKKKRKEKKQAS